MNPERPLLHPSSFGNQGANVQETTRLFCQATNIMIRTRRGLAVGLLFLLLLLTGCGRGDGGGPKLAPVRGREVYKNQAVTAADIFFLPDAANGNNGTMATAILHEDGA